MTKSQVGHGMSRNFSTVAQLLFDCREKAVNAHWSILVYATKLQCATWHVKLAILSRDKVARVNCRCDIGLMQCTRCSLIMLLLPFSSRFSSCILVSWLFLGPSTPVLQKRSHLVLMQCIFIGQMSLLPPVIAD